MKIIKNKNNKSGIYNVGFGTPHEVKTIIEKIRFIIKKGKPNYGAIKMRKDEIMHLYPNINKICKKYKWWPKVHLSEGLKKTINFYKKINSQQD